MKSKTIMLIVGTRPEAIKMAPVWHSLRASGESLKTFLVATGQHRQMLDQTMADFEMVPDCDLDLMAPGQTLPDLTGRVITAMTEILRTVAPDAVLVQGDTTTVLGASLAAFYEHIPIGHVEAGLRTYNYEAPWPEEMNRRLVDAIARWCFAPTIMSRDNLLSERIAPEAIHVTGNTVIDALLMMADRVQKKPPVFPLLDDIGSASRRMIFITGHRRESFGQKFRDVCEGFREIANRFEDVHLVYPVHLNPNVQAPVRSILADHPRISLIDPVDYPVCVRLMRESHFIISDSGGIQEEAPALGKCVMVTRSTTERPEGLECGNIILVGTDRKRIVDEASRLLSDEAYHQTRSKPAFPYGDGTAARQITEILLAWVEQSQEET